MPENSPTSGRRWAHPVVTGTAGLVIGAAGVGLAWGLSAGATSASKTFTLKGTLTLTGDNVPSGDTSENCTGYEGYDDIGAGAAVTVYDNAGKAIAQGALGVGKPHDAACVFHAAVPGVPNGPRFYQVEVSHRGKLTVSSTEAKAGGFAASLG
ncbi:hypothetical protein ABZ636_39900 [Streptomyces sp. NPDC007251]|uniref:hypothetical protein n=1 Tax=Streptomyces sp. NPDC007251 TaxID=3154483 RepID=UPI0033EEAF7F